MTNQEKIQTKMLEHGMVMQFESKVEGATVDLYRYMPSIGLRMKRVGQYVADIEQVLGMSGVRILAPIPDTELIGFEVPRKQRSFPILPKKTDGFNLAVGETVMGKPKVYDIRLAPHMLVAGASGSGKSIWLSTQIEQLNRIPKRKVEIHLYDPKMVELAHHQFDKNVVDYQTEIMDIHFALKGLVGEMNRRYKILAKARVRNIESYTGKMPYKVVVVDEFGDLVMQDYIDEQVEKTGEVFKQGDRKGEEKTRTVKTQVSKEISKNVLLLAQKARAAGIHLIISTQRPSTDVITGTIKANFPTKILFQTAKSVDSIVVMDEPGAEKLKGKGDMIFIAGGINERLQGYLSQ